MWCGKGTSAPVSTRKYVSVMLSWTVSWFLGPTLFTVGPAGLFPTWYWTPRIDKAPGNAELLFFSWRGTNMSDGVRSSWWPPHYHYLLNLWPSNICLLLMITSWSPSPWMSFPRLERRPNTIGLLLEKQELKEKARLVVSEKRQHWVHECWRFRLAQTVDPE
jgi:hypothetical protein